MCNLRCCDSRRRIISVSSSHKVSRCQQPALWLHLLSVGCVCGRVRHERREKYKFLKMKEFDAADGQSVCCIFLSELCDLGRKKNTNWDVEDRKKCVKKKINKVVQVKNRNALFSIEIKLQYNVFAYRLLYECAPHTSQVHSRCFKAWTCVMEAISAPSKALQVLAHELIFNFLFFELISIEMFKFLPSVATQFLDDISLFISNALSKAAQYRFESLGGNALWCVWNCVLSCEWSQTRLYQRNLPTFHPT